MKMHILLLSDNWPPEVNAPASRGFEHARVWVRAGHRVTVITSVPNFPQGKVHDGYRNALLQDDRMAGIRVIRVGTFIAENRGFALRTLDYLSFMAMATLVGFGVRRVDVVVATSPQFFSAVAGCALSAMRGVPFVFELRDLWPASIAAVGAMRPGRLLRALERLEEFLYHRAHAIVSVTHAFRRELVSRGVDSRKIAVVTNGVDASRFFPQRRREDLAASLGLDGRFVVGYIGTHGLAHGLGHVVDAASLLRDDDRIRFLFVGDGADRLRVIERARVLGLRNTVFVPAQPKEAMPAYWSLTDLCLISLRDTPTFTTVIPSKLFEAMGMGVAVLLSGPAGEAADIVAATGCGIAIPPERPDEIARATADLASRPDDVARFARAGHACSRRFDRDSLALRMSRFLAHVGRRRRDRRRVDVQS